MYVTVECFRNRRKSYHWDMDNLDRLTEESQVQREAPSLLTHIHNLKELDSGKENKTMVTRC